MAKRVDRSAPEGRPLQWADLSPEAQAQTNTQMARQGMAKSNTPVTIAEIDQRIERADAKGTASAKRVAKSLRADRAAIQAVQPALSDTPMTLESAAANRVALSRQGAARAAADASRGFAGGSRLRALGAGWYFDHRADLNAVAAEHGIDEDTIAVASAVMSPRNSPVNEKHAVAALAHLHKNNPTITFSEKAQKALGVGASSRFSDLSDEQAARLGTSDLREHISGVDSSVLLGLAKGGPHSNVAKAVGVIRGTVDRETAIDPHSAPKVWSYADSIRQARPNSPEHHEYMERANQALFEMPGQQRLDLFGLQHSREGILSPTKTTAEDTWQMAISNSQPLESVDTGRHNLSPAKVISSTDAYTDLYGPKKRYQDPQGRNQTLHPDARIGPTAITHAWHNQATVDAAAQLSRESGGVIVPSVLAQEVPWVESRRVADKDDTTGWTEWRDSSARGLSASQFPQGKVYNPARPQRASARHNDAMQQTSLQGRQGDGSYPKDPKFVQDSLF